jgi:hypothetical protein
MNVVVEQGCEVAIVPATCSNCSAFDHCDEQLTPLRPENPPGRAGCSKDVPFTGLVSGGV